MAISWLIGPSVGFRLHLGRYSHHTPVLMGLQAPLAYPEFRLDKDKVTGVQDTNATGLLGQEWGIARPDSMTPGTGRLFQEMSTQITESDASKTSAFASAACTFLPRK